MIFFTDSGAWCSASHCTPSPMPSTSFPACLVVSLSASRRHSTLFFFFLMTGRPPRSTLFPYTPLSRSAYGKPVAPGARDGRDTGPVDARAGDRAIVLPESYLFDEPLSPHLAARLAGERIDPAALLADFERHRAGERTLVIETAGGLLVPLAEGGGDIGDAPDGNSGASGGPGLPGQRGAGGPADPRTPPGDRALRGRRADPRAAAPRACRSGGGGGSGAPLRPPWAPRPPAAAPARGPGAGRSSGAAGEPRQPRQRRGRGRGGGRRPQEPAPPAPRAPPNSAPPPPPPLQPH